MLNVFKNSTNLKDISYAYANIKNIITAAYLTGSDSIHPGFGFLSENAEFAKICKESNIKFIGPTHKVIDLCINYTSRTHTVHFSMYILPLQLRQLY